MAMVIYLMAAILALGALYLALRVVGRAYLKFRGTRVVTCPEAKESAAVHVDAGYTAVMAALGNPRLRLKECSLWPERQNCGQHCLKQIEAAPEDCLVRTILTRWYQGKSCVYCSKPLGDIHWSNNKPALMSPDLKTVEWNELPAQTVPGALATHQPVCWNCHIAQTFRRKYPELVVDREGPSRANR